MDKDGARRKSKKRDDILHAAEILFMQKGLNLVTVEEIVQYAKVSKATFYKYYYDKKDIAEQVFKILVDIGIKDLSEILETSSESGMTRNDFMSMFDTNRYDQLYQSGFIKELFLTYPDLSEQLSKSELSRVMAAYQSFMKEAQQSGIIRADIDAHTHMTFTAIIKKGLAEHLKEHSSSMDNQSIKELNQVVNKLYLEGVLTRSTPMNGM